jgi:hypothetical protein
MNSYVTTSYVTTSATRPATPSGYVTLPNTLPRSPLGYVTLPTLREAAILRPVAGSYICTDRSELSWAA